MSIDVSSKRIDYTKNTLDDNAPDTPFLLFNTWFAQAKDEQEPYAMSLATCRDNNPSVRTVLMRQFDQYGLVFFSNYDSHKGQDLADNPVAQALFFWQKCERQVRISGKVHKLPQVQSERYFATRPTQSKLAAWASTPQSGIIQNRYALERNFADAKARFGDDVPMPDFWGGYVIVPSYFEFWQGRQGRLHDRICYSLQDGVWIQARLMP